MSVKDETITQELAQDYYEKLHDKIVDYLINGKLHSTIVGIVIALDGDRSKNDAIEAERFANYFVDFLKKME